MEAQNREWTVPQIAAFLFAAVLKLARVCDGARSEDGHGFNKFDTERGHRFADDDPETWDADKCSYVRRFLWKYRGQLLDNHGIDMTQVPDALQLQQVPRTIKFERAYGGQFVLAWDYHDNQFGEIKDAVKALDQRRYQGGTKVWVVPAELAHDVAELAGRFGFEISDGARRVIDGETELAPLANIRLGEGDGNLVFEFPYDPDMLNLLKATWEFRKWDREDRVWRVNIDSPEDAGSVVGFAKRFELTIDPEAQAMIDRIGGRKPRKADRKPAPAPARERVAEPVQEPREHGQYRQAAEPKAKPEKVKDEPVSEPVSSSSDMGRNWSAGNALKLFE
jgi:hypothetical protein